jgi:hypothetical protein
MKASHLLSPPLAGGDKGEGGFLSLSDSGESLLLYESVKGFEQSFP